jgi:predicted TIM-barrel fold metal-dependent hydrolase
VNAVGAEADGPGGAPRPPTVIDVHMHVYRSTAEGERAKGGYDIWEYGPWHGVRISDALGDVESARAALRGARASAAIVTNLLEPPTPGADPKADLIEFNEWLCQLAAEDDRFVPFISVDSRWQTVPEQVAHLRSMVQDRGARGIKIHPPIQGLDLTDRSNWPVFEACRDLGVGVISHSGPSRSGPGRGEPDDFRALLTAVPELRLSVAHLGGRTWRQAAGLARSFQHVFFDCCEIVEWLGAPFAPTPEECVTLIREIGVERVMMGSDFPWYEVSQTVATVNSLPGLTDSERRLILGENAERFLASLG